jgi:glycosyltransferase involved in cell wall biosynthesis
MGQITDVGDVLSAADIFLSTSLHEGMPLAVLEAFATGLPCVLSPIEEHREIAANMDGTILLEETTPSAVAEALRSLIEQPALLRSFALSRKQQLERFTSKHCATAYSNLYQLLSRTDVTDISEVHLQADE